MIFPRGDECDEEFINATTKLRNVCIVAVSLPMRFEQVEEVDWSVVFESMVVV